MTIEFKEDVFTEHDQIFPPPTVITDPNSEFKYSVECTMGNCPMNYDNDDNE